MNDRLRWILPVPFLIFGTGAWVYFHTENEVRVQMERAQSQWREGNYFQALDLYKGVQQNYPQSRYADDALWEIATIYYVNFYDIDQALQYLRKLVSEYPHSQLVASAYLRLAEIQETELGDLRQALDCLKDLLALELSPDIYRRVLFRMGNVYLKMNEFSKALQRFHLLIADEAADHLAEQARIRMGTILQIQHEYEKSITYFHGVLDKTTCVDCRVAARLGMIESYEFLGDLARAIRIARAIPATEFAQEMKEELLERLQEKARHYNPGLAQDH